MLGSAKISTLTLLITQIAVAEDLFVQKNNNSQGSGGATKDLAELESQRELVMNMLLKLIIYPEAMEIVITVIGALKNEGEEKWRKVCSPTKPKHFAA